MLIAQSCPPLCHPTDCSLPGSSVHGILWARILEWVAITFSRESSQSRDWIQVSCIAGDSLLSEPPGEPGVQKCLPIPLCHVQLFSSMISHPGRNVYLFFECQASMSGHPVTSRADDMMVWVGTNSPSSGLTCFLSWGLKSGFMLTTPMALPEYSFARVPNPCQMQTGTATFLRWVSAYWSCAEKSEHFWEWMYVSVHARETEKEHAFLLQWNRIYE